VIQIFGAKNKYRIERKSEIIYKKDPPPIGTIIDTDYKHHTIDTPSGSQKVVFYPHGELKSIGYLLYFDKKTNQLAKQIKIREDVYIETEGLLAIAP